MTKPLTADPIRIDRTGIYLGDKPVPAVTRWTARHEPERGVFELQLTLVTSACHVNLDASPGQLLGGPLHACAPSPLQVERIYGPPLRDGVGEVIVTPQALATLRPGPDGVPITVEPETVTPGQPIRPGVIGAELSEVPETAIRRLLELAWDRSTFRDADADLLGAVERWLHQVAPKAGAEVAQ